MALAHSLPSEPLRRSRIRVCCPSSLLLPTAETSMPGEWLGRGAQRRSAGAQHGNKVTAAIGGRSATKLPGQDTDRRGKLKCLTAGRRTSTCADADERGPGHGRHWSENIDHRQPGLRSVSGFFPATDDVRDRGARCTSGGGTLDDVSAVSSQAAAAGSPANAWRRCMV